MLFTADRAGVCARVNPSPDRQATHTSFYLQPATSESAHPLTCDAISLSQAADRRDNAADARTAFPVASDSDCDLVPRRTAGDVAAAAASAGEGPGSWSRRRSRARPPSSPSRRLRVSTTPSAHNQTVSNAAAHYGQRGQTAAGSVLSALHPRGETEPHMRCVGWP